MRVQTTDKWKVWHCEELCEIEEAVYCDDEKHTYEVCVHPLMCALAGECVTHEVKVREVRIIADQQLVLINPLPEPKEKEHEVVEITVDGPAVVVSTVGH